MAISYSRLRAEDSDTLRGLLGVFRNAFGEPESEREFEPDDGYISTLLGDPTCVVLVARNERNEVVGGLVAYELRKFEQRRSELYLYDLAIDESYRRQGIATELIERLGLVGAAAGAYVIFVQADTVDAPAVALYTKLCCSVEADVVHFDIAIRNRQKR
jgi:aminoglycoside 3-N-acetyltransferase I